MSTARTQIDDSSGTHTSTGSGKKIVVTLLCLVLLIFAGLASMSLVAAQRTERQRAAVGMAGGQCEFEHRVPGWLSMLGGDDFHSFLDYPVIAGVVMGGEKIGDANVARLPDMPELRTLDLDSSQVTSTGLERVSQLKSLRMLNLSNTQVTDITPLSALPQLEALQLNFSQVRREHLTGLSKLKNVTVLGAGYIQVTDQDIIEIAKCPQLEELNIAASVLTEDGLQPLKALEHLKTLVLVKARFDADDLKAFKAARPDVTVVE